MNALCSEIGGERKRWKRKNRGLFKKIKKRKKGGEIDIE